MDKYDFISSEDKLPVYGKLKDCKPKIEMMHNLSCGSGLEDRMKL